MSLLETFKEKGARYLEIFAANFEEARAVDILHHPRSYLYLFNTWFDDLTAEDLADKEHRRFLRFLLGFYLGSCIIEHHDGKWLIKPRGPDPRKARYVVQFAPDRNLDPFQIAEAMLDLPGESVLIGKLNEIDLSIEIEEM